MTDTPAPELQPTTAYMKPWERKKLEDLNAIWGGKLSRNMIRCVLEAHDRYKDEIDKHYAKHPRKNDDDHGD